MERNVKKEKVFLNITSMPEWKKKHRVDRDTWVFIVKGKKYPELKQALFRRGWVENDDKYSPCFDLKWTVKIKDILDTPLQDWQLVNHFTEQASLTFKSGLNQSLKQLIWFKPVNIDTFYTRTFDCTIPEEFEDFKTEFKATKAQCVLKTYVREMRTSYSNYKSSGNPADLKSESTQNNVLEVAQNICEKKTRDLDDLIDDPHAFQELVSDQEWTILNSTKPSKKE